MRKVREVLRLKFECGCTQRQISASCGISCGSVSDYLGRASAAGVTWEIATAMSDADLEQRLFRHVGRNEPAARAPVDFPWVHRELGKIAVTLQLLWVEYAEAARAAGSRPYQYSQFCDRYVAWKATLASSMRQVHRAGDKLFIDYSGKRPRIVDQGTGEVRDVELFVAVLGASNYTFAEATLTQRLADFVASTIRALEHFGGVPAVLVPDQLRSAVSGPDRYEPDINATYLEMAQHYGVAVIPARPRKPKDKAKVEGGVLIAQRWILACLRNRTFFTLDELNLAIDELLEKLNRRPFQKLDGCRRSAFETLDRPALKPLPPTRYEKADWKKATVHIDYHVAFDDRFYSAPHALIGMRVELRATSSTVEILHGGERVASHPRSRAPKGTCVTSEQHRPPAHRAVTAWPPDRMLAWAASFGPSVARVVELMMARYPHPESAYRACLGMIRCADKYGASRADAACARALAVAGPVGPQRKAIEAMLKSGLDRAPVAPALSSAQPVHENVRGGDYYDKKETDDSRRNDPEARHDEAAHAGEGPARDAGHASKQSTLF
jgi:transposase